MMSLLTNRWVAYAAGVLALLIGLRVWLGIHDHRIKADAIAAQEASVAAAVREGQERQAQDLIAAYNRSQEAEANVNQQIEGYQNINADLMRRVEWLRQRAQVRPGGVPAAGSDPARPDFDSEATGLLLAEVADTAAQCAADYGNVAAKLEAIGELTDKVSAPSSK